MQPTQKKILSFFEILEHKLPDHRDNRGKRHNLSFILTGVILALVSGRSYPASIQRYLKNHYSTLCAQFCIKESKPISRAQLPRLLQGVDWQHFNRLSSEYLSLTIDPASTYSWQSVDGKELRGSIATGLSKAQAKRGLCLVRVIDQQSHGLRAQSFYHGKKESEKAAVRQLLKQENLYGCKLSFDALHSDPETLSSIAMAGGSYLVQIKANQQQLYEQLEVVPRYLAPQAKNKQIEKGHGRLEKRLATIFDLNQPLFLDGLDKKWKNADIQSLIKVEREFHILKSKRIQHQFSYYISNEKINQKPKDKVKQWAEAIRKHWAIESDNFVRDTTLEEDQMKSQNDKLQMVMAVLRSTALEIMKKCNKNNFKALAELFADNPTIMFQQLKNIHFL